MFPLQSPVRFLRVRVNEYLDVDGMYEFVFFLGLFSEGVDIVIYLLSLYLTDRYLWGLASCGLLIVRMSSSL